MDAQYILSEYLGQAMAQAEYDKLEDGTFSGRIASCKGVVAFGATLRECEDELRSTLEDWLLVGLKLEHVLPVIDGIDLRISALRFNPTSCLFHIHRRPASQLAHNRQLQVASFPLRQSLARVR